MAHSSGYFVLFPTHKLPLTNLNNILDKAEEGAKDMYNSGWYFYVPTNNDLNHAIPPNHVTKTPVKEVASDFIGKPLEELASILMSAPKEVDMNRQFFAVYDERTESDGSLVLCHVAEEGKVDCLRCWPKNASLYLRGMSMYSPPWHEIKTIWERKKAKGEDVID